MKGSVCCLLHVSPHFVSFTVALSFMLDCYLVPPLYLKNQSPFQKPHKYYWQFIVLSTGHLHL